VADHRDAAAGCGVEGFGDALDPLDGAVGAIDVEDEAHGVRAVADQPQPAPQHEQAVIAGEKARQDDDRPPVAPRDPSAVGDGVDDEPPDFQNPAALRERAALPAARDRRERPARVRHDAWT
jgi:hypothetical protein